MHLYQRDLPKYIRSVILKNSKKKIYTRNKDIIIPVNIFTRMINQF